MAFIEAHTWWFVVSALIFLSLAIVNFLRLARTGAGFVTGLVLHAMLAIGWAGSLVLLGISIVIHIIKYSTH